VTEPPVCASCGGRHWFLDPCGTNEPAPAAPGPLAATATPAEIERALRAYRAKRAKARDRMRRVRAHKG